MVYGKSIGLFLVNGSADSLVTAELSNWNGKAMGKFSVLKKHIELQKAH